MNLLLSRWKSLFLHLIFVKRLQKALRQSTHVEPHCSALAHAYYTIPLPLATPYKFFIFFPSLWLFAYWLRFRLGGRKYLSSFILFRCPRADNWIYLKRPPFITAAIDFQLMPNYLLFFLWCCVFAALCVVLFVNSDFRLSRWANDNRLCWALSLIFFDEIQWFPLLRSWHSKFVFYFAGEKLFAEQVSFNRYFQQL